MNTQAMRQIVREGGSTPRVTVRLLSAGVGLGAALFGLPALVLPEWFARQFGIGAAEQQSVATAIRSVGVRDIVIGLALARAAARQDHASVHDWLFARAACDAGDAIAVGIALARGERNPRFVALGLLAAGASVIGAVLVRASAHRRRNGSRQVDVPSSGDNDVEQPGNDVPRK